MAICSFSDHMSIGSWLSEVIDRLTEVHKKVLSIKVL
jgi:hypothetical protein